MASANDNRISAEARRWVDSIESKWRLQVLTVKFRLNAKGEKVELPTRIRRFVEGIPHALVDEAIRYLISLAPYRGIIYNGVPIEGEYRPTLTQWMRDNNDNIHTAGKGQNDGTYTLVQDLIEHDLWDRYGTPSSVSCSEEVVAEYVWDAPDVEELPVVGDMQGVTYAIQGVQRGEDGTFSYSLVKRTAKTQHLPKHVTRTDRMQTVEVEGWKSVYGDFETGWRDEAGTPLDIPVASQTQGVIVVMQYSLQPDCTYDISAETTTSNPVKVTRETQKTLYQHEATDGLYGQRSALSDAPKASGGVIKTHANQLQPDGTYHTSEKTLREQNVLNSEVRVTHDYRGLVRTVTNKGQSSAPSLSVSLGESVSYQRTPGNLYDVTTVSRTYQKHVGAVSCKQTIYQHDHTESAGSASLFSGHVAKASGGVIKSVQSRVDQEGFITTEDGTVTELPVESSRKTVTATPFGLVTTVVDTNQSAAAKTSGLSVGESVQVEKTPGGLYTNTYTNFTPRLYRQGMSCGKTLFEHKHSTTSSVSAFPTDHVAAAGEGYTYSRTAQVQSDGSVVQTDSTDAELHVPVFSVSASRTAHTVRTTTAYKNAPSSQTTKLSSPGDAYSYQRTPGGRYDGQVTRVAAAPGAEDSTCAKTVFQHDHSTTTYSTAPGTREATAAGGGVTYQVSVRQDNEGLYACTSQKSTELQESYRKSSSSSQFTDQSTETTKNSSESPQDSSFSEGSIVTREGTRTPGGRWDLTTTTNTAKAADWDYEVDTNWFYSYTIQFRNQKQNFIDTAIEKCKTKLRLWCNQDTMAARLPSSYSISPSAQLNDYGLYDGGCSLQVHWQFDSAGKDAVTDTVLFTTEWKVYNVSAETNHVSSLTKNGLKRYAVVSRIIDEGVHQLRIGRGVSKLKEQFDLVKNNAKPYGLKGADVSFSVTSKVFSLKTLAMGKRKTDKLVYDETNYVSGEVSTSSVSTSPEDGGSL